MYKMDKEDMKLHKEHKALLQKNAVLSVENVPTSEFPHKIQSWYVYPTGIDVVNNYGIVKFTDNLKYPDESKTETMFIPGKFLNIPLK